jgi:NAD(P)H-hydrate repair Nnr-like enzyme with NAD(P)H-hydrate dehydratase domain
MAQLTGTSPASAEADPAVALDEAVEKVRAVVALRGAETRIGTPDGERFLDRSGHPGLATAGSGDVLAGILGGLMARGADPLTAALWAVHVHGTTGNRLAATRYPLGILARDLLDAVPESFAILSQ